MIDFHSHFLPGCDDGARNSRMSIDMLLDSKAQGVETVVATPHFYCTGKTVEQFLERRDIAYNRMLKRINEWGAEVPEIKLGAEVHASVSLSEIPDLDKLCIEGTRYILLEMPYQTWQPWIYEMIYSLIVKFDVIPIMAHMERYMSINKKIEDYYELLSMNVLGQANAEGFLSFSSRRFLSKLIEKDMIHVIGSDMHNMDSRKSCIGAAVSKIEKKFGKELMNTFENNAKNILLNKRIK